MGQIHPVSTIAVGACAYARALRAESSGAMSTSPLALLAGRDRLLTMPEIARRADKSNVTIYNMIRRGTFPVGVPIGNGYRKVWPESLVAAYFDAIRLGFSPADATRVAVGAGAIGALPGQDKATAPAIAKANGIDAEETAVRITAAMIVEGLIDVDADVEAIARRIAEGIADADTTSDA
jgi:predicted DNA-binding transcriptional regulator AlpA